MQLLLWLVYPLKPQCFAKQYKKTTVLFELLVVLALTQVVINHLSAKVGRGDLQKK